MSQFPIISRVIEECGKLEAFQQADPFKQPDCPEDLRKWRTKRAAGCRVILLYSVEFVWFLK